MPLELIRYDAGLEVPESLVLDENVSEIFFPAMTIAELEIKGSVELELRALDYMYRTWLPRSGFLPDHQPGFEAFLGEPFAHGMEYFELKLQLPVVRDVP